MSELGIEEVDTYFLLRKNIIAQYIMTRLILKLCLAVEWRTGARVSRQWWEKDGIYQEGVRETMRAM